MLDVKVVIFFVVDLRLFLKVIENDYYIRNMFRFIGIDKWGEDLDIWEGLENMKCN